jgi:aryl-alcohol dehydrogenase-like predicted oxidoreductase
VTSPIIGASKEGHLEDAIASLDVKLDEADLKELETPYLPQSIIGHR